MVIVGLASSWEVRAQTPSLEEVDRLVAAGQVDQARGLLELWWGDRYDGADRLERQRALLQRARLTSDAQEAEPLYRRLAVEFPGGPYTDEALLRLAQLAEIRGDWEQARRHLGTLLEQHSESPLRLEARAWLERRDERERLFPEQEGATEPQPQLEPEAELDPQPGPELEPEPESRTHPLPPLDPDPAPSPDPLPPAAEETAPSPPTDWSYTLQLGAFSERWRAEDLLHRARAAGLEARMVRVGGGELVRVRVEAFPTHSEAEERMAQVLELGFEVLVASDREREVGDP